MADVLICPRCSRQTLNADTCVRCGEPIPSYFRHGTVRCPSCLKGTPENEDACRHCGHTIPAYLRADVSKFSPSTDSPEPAFLERPEPAPAPPAEVPTAEEAELAPAFIPSTLAALQREPAKDAAIVPAKRPRPQTPDTSMKLLIRRNQKSGPITGRVAFTIDVRAKLSPETAALVKKYRMGKETLFYKEKVDLSSFWLLGPFQQILRIIAAHIWNIKITVNDLMHGKHMECKDIREMLDAEEQIREASATFKMILDRAAHFGGEEVVDL